MPSPQMTSWRSVNTYVWSEFPADSPPVPVVGYSHHGKSLQAGRLTITITREAQHTYGNPFAVKVLLEGAVIKKDGTPGQVWGESTYELNGYRKDSWQKMPDWISAIVVPFIDSADVAPVFGVPDA